MKMAQYLDIDWCQGRY